MQRLGLMGVELSRLNYYYYELNATRQFLPALFPVVL